MIICHLFMRSHTNHPGDCVMTVGTNDKTALKIHDVKLLPSHDYAVTGKAHTTRKTTLHHHLIFVPGIRESNDERWVTLLDSRLCSPPCECLTNSASGSCPSESPYFCPFVVYEWNGMAGVLDMRWDDICATFEGLYISWDPNLFRDVNTFHG